jgi:hypothetical protein
VQLLLQPEQLKQANAAAKAKARGETSPGKAPAAREPAPTPAVPAPQPARPASRSWSSSGGWPNDAFNPVVPGN